MNEKLTLPRRLLVLAFLIAGLWYLSWRINTFNRQALTFSILLYAAECFGFLTSCLYLWTIWSLRLPGGTRWHGTGSQGLPGLGRSPSSHREGMPTSGQACSAQHQPEVLLPQASAGAAEPLFVDVFIPTYNEPADIVRRTLLCARAMRYPHNTYLLDDGHRDQMRQLADELGIHYLTRDTNKHAKAGNLNHALSQTTSPFIAIFDADHAPLPDFLDKTIPHFADESVAFVQTPQEYYNLDSFQHCWRNDQHWHEQTLFFRVIQPGKDRHNAAFFCGTGAVLRRSALESVGGFATQTVTEDLHTSIRLHKRGYKSVYVNEPLAFGIAPQTFAAYAKQRTRWAIGNLQVWWHEWILLGRGLSLTQRLSYLSSILTYFEGPQRLILCLTPILVMLTGIMPIKTIDWRFMLHFLPYFILSIAAFVAGSRGYGWYSEAEMYGMARLGPFVKATLLWWLPRRRFAVTAKSRASQPRSTRYLPPQFAILFFSVAAIPLGIWRCIDDPKLPWRAIAISAIWAILNAQLAWSVIRNARAADRCRRREYRFPRQLPIVLTLTGQQTPGHSVDLSPAGMCCELNHPDSTLAGGTKLSGQLKLAADTITFHAVVTGSSQHDNRARYHLRFTWTNDACPEQLELALMHPDTTPHMPQSAPARALPQTQTALAP